ncbi:hypothetical protein [Brevibacillus laterosporus]|uniref:hypothetical protein n=1 Tax=Brevibacillus laterosporus TaxID=1465 RepID=UPI003D1EBF15
MNKTQIEYMLKMLRWINFETIKAQKEGDQKQEVLLGINLSGVAYALVTLGHREFLEMFYECECGHNFELTGEETEDELQKHYSEMDKYYQLFDKNLSAKEDANALRSLQ